MKLKNLIDDNKLSKFIDYINSIDFNKYAYKGKYSEVKNNGLYLISFNNDNIDKIKSEIIELIKKYWKNFESGIDFHKYDGEYFIQIKQDNENRYSFIIESLDDDFYCVFDNDFIVNL